ncbi:flagellar biosynthesis anti-sigma factor FlgM [Sulfurimonas sp. MAG313]|nr:flagellar biosynthesis anti-sigma factor FlgM [Sulfurimonas sp. MAG313]MDF1879982.1 flagellar biosynthesis anti-sigma factor FlgM [Sulfurimonas sp. MAG313]
MISKVGTPAIRNTYQENEAKDASKTPRAVDKQGDTSKIEQLKSSIENGEYTLDLKALAKKIGEELL